MEVILIESSYKLFEFILNLLQIDNIGILLISTEIVGEEDSWVIKTFHFPH